MLGVLTHNQQPRAPLSIADLKDPIGKHGRCQSRRQMKSRGNHVLALAAYFILNSPVPLSPVKSDRPAMHHGLRQSLITKMFSADLVGVCIAFPVQHARPGLVPDYERSAFFSCILFRTI